MLLIELGREKPAVGALTSAKFGTPVLASWGPDWRFTASLRTWQRAANCSDEVLILTRAGVDHLAAPVHDHDEGGPRHVVRPCPGTLVVKERPEWGAVLGEVAPDPVLRVVHRHVHPDQLDPVAEGVVHPPELGEQRLAKRTPRGPELEEDGLLPQHPPEIHRPAVEIVDGDCRRLGADGDAGVELGGGGRGGESQNRDRRLDGKTERRKDGRSYHTCPAFTK